MVVTDLDGTLLNSSHQLSERNLDTLQNLGEIGITRIIATGRSVFSAKNALPSDLPLDFLVFSSGSGIEDWDRKKLLKSCNLSREEVFLSYNLLIKKGIDFFVLDAVPNNHYCAYLKQNPYNPDFDSRLALYKEFAREIDRNHFIAGEACQLIGIAYGEEAAATYQQIKNSIEDLNVVRSTSPIDGKSVWIEIYPREASKSNGLVYLSDMLHIEPEDTMVIGNDYNDLDMLRWTAHPFVVANAPVELRNEFPVVASNDDDGFSNAVELWLKGYTKARQ
jgi:Cof subfamily protein (haloacid dehalogenase superfamily)